MDAPLFRSSACACRSTCRGWRDDALDRCCLAYQPILRPQMAQAAARDRGPDARPEGRSQAAYPERRARAVLWPKAFGADPGFQQRAINREMLASNARMNSEATSPCNRRSRFLVKVVASHTGSSTPRPANQRNRRSKSMRSTNWRSEWIE